MSFDPDSLRQHYASLSDEALLEINREDLVETAQRCYDDELAQRQLASEVEVPGSSPADEKGEFDHEAPGSSDQPDWLEEAAEVYSRYDLTGTGPTSDVVDARDALEAAGIPCHLDLIPEEKSDTRTPTHRWRLTVPGNLNLHATSVLDRDIFNAEFEAEWRAHLETFSDEELRAMTPRSAFCGLFDRVERVTRAYDKEMARRGLRH